MIIRRHKSLNEEYKIMSGHKLHNDTIDLPESVTAVFTNFLTCEMTTIGKSGSPITWPVMPIYWPERGQFILFTSIGLPQKAFNIRRNPQVSLLFSDSTGSGLENPLTVLVQGDAKTSDEILAAFSGFDPEILEMVLVQARKMFERQPAMKLYTSNPFARYMMDWYFMRLMITITPRSIQWWPGQKWPAGEFATTEFSPVPVRAEVDHVG